MKSLVVYDSTFGNTEKIAQSIAAGLKPLGAVKITKASASALADVEGTGLLIVGSPILGGRPSSSMQAFLSGLPAGSLDKVKIAAFDTRMTMPIAKLFGSAAVRMEATLKAKGGSSVATPEGFIVMGRSGPLKTGEIERAAEWARSLAEQQKTDRH